MNTQRTVAHAVLIGATLLAPLGAMSAAHAGPADTIASAVTAGGIPKCQIVTAAPATTACIDFTFQAVGATQGVAPANTEFTCTVTAVGAVTNVVLNYCRIGAASAAPFATAALTSTALGITNQSLKNGLLVCASATAVIPAAKDFNPGEQCALIGGSRSATETYTGP